MQVVLCTGQAVNLGTLGGPLFRLAFCDRSVSLFERHGNLLWCALCGVMSQDARKRRKVVALTLLVVTHDGDDDDGLS